MTIFPLPSTGVAKSCRRGGCGSTSPPNRPGLAQAACAVLRTRLILGDRSHALDDPRLVEPDDVVQPPLPSPVWARRRVVNIVEDVGRRRQKLVEKQAFS